MTIRTKREDGFTLIEVLAATAIMLVIMAATVSALTDAIHATQGVALMADTQENLRAGMNFITRDLTQAGVGIPQGGITIPAAGVPWPSTGINFSSSGANWGALPAIAPGYQLGPQTSTSGVKTDVLTILYSDTTLQDAAGNWLNKYPINLAASCPNGKIVKAGSTTTVTFDTTCITLGSSNTSLHAGDLILLQNNSGSCSGGNSMVSSASCNSDNPGSSMVLWTVSTVAPGSNQVTFTTGDAFGLNASTLPAGTVTATRVWMITYYIDNSNAQRPQLMREVNLNGANAVGDVIENMQIFYDIVQPSSNPPALAAVEQESPTFAQLPYIRDAYIMLFARSQDASMQGGTYFRNNLSTTVSIRGLSFYNEYN
jgi:prepilin-type N-terminal cleavage/methylation domain-containing protein